jgi:hypothetical protein
MSSAFSGTNRDVDLDILFMIIDPLAFWVVSGTDDNSYSRKSFPEGIMAKFNLDRDFNRFAGKEVDVVETVNNTKYGRVSSSSVVEPSPVVDELRAALDEAGFSLRLWLPGFAGTSDHRSNRVNVYVNKDADGRYRIGRFEIG